MKEKNVAHENPAQEVRQKTDLEALRSEAVWREDWQRIVGKTETGRGTEEAIHVELLGRMIRIENLVERVLRYLQLRGSP